MSIIQKIRDKAAWLVVGAIAVSLLAFIIQDALGRKSSLFGSSSTIGKVNGTKISREDFQKKIDFYTKQNQGRVTTNQLVSGVWDLMVQKTIMDEQYANLGIDVSPKELNDIMFGANPPDWLTREFTDKNTGIFDVNKAKKAIQNLKTKTNDPQVQGVVEGLINPTIEQRKLEKYQSLISGAIYVPKWLAEKQNADANAIAKASYVYVPYSSIADSTIKVSDDEIAAYISKHSKQFEKKEETRVITYATFSALPTATDTTEVKNNLNLLKNEFAQATDIKSFLSVKGSQMDYYDGFIGRKDNKQSAAITDSLFNVPAGGFYGPYTDGGNIVLAKVVATRSIPDSAKVRHILVATHQQDPQTGSLFRIRDDSAAVKRLDSAIALIKTGASWDSVCLKYSDDPGSSSNGGVYNNFPTGQMEGSFNDFAFTGAVGETKTVQTSYGYHYMQVLGQTGSQTGYKIAYLAKPIVPSNETDNAASNAAAAFASTAHDAKQFTDIATKQKITVLPSMEFKKMDFEIAGLGECRSLIKWAYENDKGEVSEPFNLQDKYVVAMISAINPKGPATVESAKMNVEALVRNEKKAQIIINTKFKGNTLADIAKSAGDSVRVVDSLAFTGYQFGSEGNEPKAIGTAFNKQLQNKISAPIAGNSGVFVIMGQGISATSSLGSNADMQRTQLESMLKQQAGQNITALLKEDADIDDNRSEFY